MSIEKSTAVEAKKQYPPISESDGELGPGWIGPNDRIAEPTTAEQPAEPGDIDPLSISAERCCEILIAVKHRGRTNWKANTLFLFSGGSKQDRDYIEYAHSDAQIICAYFLEHGIEGREEMEK